VQTPVHTVNGDTNEQNSADQQSTDHVAFVGTLSLRSRLEGK